jgi:hypothetical protein
LNQAAPQVGHAPACEVLHQASVDVEEERVDGQIAAESVLLGRAEANLGNAARARVLLGAQVDKVNGEAPQARSGRLEVLGLVRILLNNAKLNSRAALVDAPLIQLHGKLCTRHIVQSNVNVVLPRPTKQLVAHPASRDAHRRVQLVLHHHALEHGK